MHSLPKSVVTIGAEQMQSANPAMVMILVPVLTLGVYPLVGRLATPLRRMGTGLVLAALSFVVVAWIQQQIEAGRTISLAWQGVSYLILTTGEVLLSTTGLEFAFTEAGKEMKSTIMSFWLLTVAFGKSACLLGHEARRRPRRQRRGEFGPLPVLRRADLRRRRRFPGSSPCAIATAIPPTRSAPPAGSEAVAPCAGASGIQRAAEAAVMLVGDRMADAEVAEDRLAGLGREAAREFPPALRHFGERLERAVPIPFAEGRQTRDQLSLHDVSASRPGPGGRGIHDHPQRRGIQPLSSASAPGPAGGTPAPDRR